MDEIVVLIQDRPALSVQKNASHGMRAMHPLHPIAVRSPS